MRDIIKEACVETFEEAILAEKKGADRVELCSRLDLDGLTPERKIVEKVLGALSIPIKIMIRPRAGNFSYNDQELNEMKKDILFCKDLNVQGVVFGILDQNKTIDMENMKYLCDTAGNLEITFHKAIDQTDSIIDEIDRLLTIRSISSVLSSGGAYNAHAGSRLLKKVVEKYEDIITIIPAGSITKNNIHELHQIIGAKEYHGRKIVGDLDPN